MVSKAYLDHTPLPSAVYNSLPHIDDMKSAGLMHRKAMNALLGVITAHSVHDTFSIHLVHKHFDIPGGHVMAYETIHGNNLPAIPNQHASGPF